MLGRVSLDKKFRTLLSLLEKRFGQRERYGSHGPVEQALVTLFLVDGQEAPAERALKRLNREFVDWNEVRVCEPRMIEETLGKAAQPGVGHLVADTLTAIFNHSQAMNLDDVIGLPGEQAWAKLKKLRIMPSRVVAELLLSAVGYRKLPATPGLLRVARRTQLIDGGPTDTQAAALRRIVPAALVSRTVHAFETLAERICTEHDFDCRACPLNADCPTGIEKLEQFRVEEEQRQARDAEKRRQEAVRDQKRVATKKKQVATRQLKKAFEVRSQKLKISPAKKRPRVRKHAKAPAAAPKMVQASSADVAPGRRKRKRRARKPVRRTRPRPARAT